MIRSKIFYMKSIYIWFNHLCELVAEKYFEHEAMIGAVLADLFYGHSISLLIEATIEREAIAIGEIVELEKVVAVACTIVVVARKKRRVERVTKVELLRLGEIIGLDVGLDQVFHRFRVNVDLSHVAHVAEVVAGQNLVNIGPGSRLIERI